MKAILYKKESYRESVEGNYPLTLNLERIVSEEMEEKEFGILLHQGKYCLTNGADIVAHINEYIKIDIKKE